MITQPLGETVTHSVSSLMFRLVTYTNYTEKLYAVSMTDICSRLACAAMYLLIERVALPEYLLPHPFKPFRQRFFADERILERASVLAVPPVGKPRTVTGQVCANHFDGIVFPRFRRTRDTVLRPRRAGQNPR